MKTCLATVGCVLLLAVTASAIPQTFQAPNVFLRTAGVNFEQFASDADAWDDPASLKGHWAMSGDTLTLTDSAAVFGLAADQVTAQQRDGHVLGFRVVFRPDKKTGKPVNLAEQLAANVRAFTGDAGTKLSGGGATFKYKAVTITLLPGSGREVVVEFKRG